MSNAIRECWNATHIDGPAWDDLPQVEQLQLQDFASAYAEESDELYWMQEELDEAEAAKRAAEERADEAEAELAKLGKVAG